MDPPKRVTVNVPAVLADVIERRMEELRFQSATAYFLSLAVFDLYARKPHLLTGSLQNDRPEIRDQFYREVARDFDDLQAKPPGWFEARMRELVEREAGEALHRMQEELWRIYAENRELKEELREARRESERKP